MPIDDDQVERFVFDACALIAYLNDEPGADKVEDLLDQAQQNHVQLYVTASTTMASVWVTPAPWAATRPGPVSRHSGRPVERCAARNSPGLERIPLPITG